MAYALSGARGGEKEISTALSRHQIYVPKENRGLNYSQIPCSGVGKCGYPKIAKSLLFCERFCTSVGFRRIILSAWPGTGR